MKLFFAAVAVLVSAVSAQAQLFNGVGTPVQPNPAIANILGPEPQIRARQVTLNTQHFLTQFAATSNQSPELTINLFPDLTIKSRRHSVTYDGTGRTWRGSAEGGKVWGRAIFAVYEDKIVGIVQRDQSLFIIRPITDTVQLVVEVNHRNFAREALPNPDIPNGVPWGGWFDGKSQLRVMLVMDSSLSAVCVAWWKWLFEAIYELNLNDVWDSFTTDDITADVTIYCSGHSATGGDLIADLAWVASDATVAAERNAREADLVSYIVPSSSFCGRGYYNAPPVVAADESRAFSVVKSSCALGNYSLAHELGHNLGMQHNREEYAGGGDPAQCNYGYLITNNGTPFLRSVMAYDCAAGGCDRIGAHSYPLTLSIPWPLNWSIVFGESCGVATSANNVDQLQDAAPVAEHWRP